MGSGQPSSVLLAHVTDAHVAPFGPRKAALKDQSVRIFRDLIDQIGDAGADLTLFGGDNIDNHGHGEADLDAFLSMVKPLPRSVCVVGNHEAEALSAPGVVSKSDFAARVTGHGLAADRLCFSEAVSNVRVIGIDTTLLGTSGGYVAPRVMRFLADELNRAEEEHIVVLGHHLLHRAWEPHSLHAWDKDYLVANRDNVNALLASHPRVRAYLCGHHHASRIQRIASRGESGGFYHILTASPVSYPHTARLLRFEPDGIHVRSIRPRDESILDAGKEAVMSGRKAGRYETLGAQRSFLQYLAGRTTDNDVVLPYAHAPAATSARLPADERRAAVV